MSTRVDTFEINCITDEAAAKQWRKAADPLLESKDGHFRYKHSTARQASDCSCTSTDLPDYMNSRELPTFVHTSYMPC